MAVSSPHHGIDQFSIICHDEKSFRLLIQPARISKSDRIAQDILNFHIRVPVFLRTDYPCRLIKCQNHLFITAPDAFSSNADIIFFRHLHAGQSRFPIDGNGPLSNQLIRIPSGTDTALCKIFIQPRFHSHPALSIPLF